MNVCVELFTTAWRVGEFSDKPAFYGQTCQRSKQSQGFQQLPATTWQPVKEYTLFPGDQG